MVKEEDRKKFWKLIAEGKTRDEIIIAVPGISPTVCKLWYGGWKKGYWTNNGSPTKKARDRITETHKGKKYKKRNNGTEKTTKTVINQCQTQTKLQTKDGLVGMESYKKKIKLLLQHGTKGIFIAGFHGLGKSSIVMELAKTVNAKVIRFQVTETMTEFDIVGSPNISTGKFVYSQLVEGLRDANQNPDKQYYIVLDEFTRGTPEAKQILFPLLAEKMLYINSIYSDIKAIAVTDNVKVFATGNLHDSGQCEVSQAEMDRYNIIEIMPILDCVTLKNILLRKINCEILNTSTGLSVVDELIKFYQDSWRLYTEERRILAMSIRTYIETARLALEMAPAQGVMVALKNAIGLTYYGTSQAVFNPHYKNTYDEMVAKISNH